MDRVGVPRRLPAAILDGLFVLILIGIGVTIYAAVGGARLGLQAQNALGVPVTWNNLVSEDVWQQYGRRAEEMGRDIERMIREEFTDEQAEFIGQTLNESIDGYFTPDKLSVQFFLDLDENDLDQMVDEAFDSVIAAERADISAAKVGRVWRCRHCSPCHKFRHMAGVSSCHHHTRLRSRRSCFWALVRKARAGDRDSPR